MMNAAFVQTRPVFGRIRENVEEALRKIEALSAALVVLPELFSTGYQFKSGKEALSLAEDAASGYATIRLAEAARRKKMFIVAGIAEKSGTRVFNSAVLVGPGGLIGVYRKAHLFWNEKKIFASGDTPFAVYDTGKAKVGMMICFDWVFPEVARTLALLGAEIICQPSNLVLPYCPQAMITRSIENRVYTITANRVGTEERIKGKSLKFIGCSQIVAPNGELLYRAGKSAEEAFSAGIDPKKARKKSITPVNDLFKDRRTDLFKV